MSHAWALFTSAAAVHAYRLISLLPALDHLSLGETQLVQCILHREPTATHPHHGTLHTLRHDGNSFRWDDGVETITWDVQLANGEWMYTGLNPQG